MNAPNEPNKPKPTIKVNADGVTLEFPFAGGTAAVSLDKTEAAAMLTKLAEFSRNPEVRQRFALGVLNLFLDVTKDDPK